MATANIFEAKRPAPSIHEQAAVTVAGALVFVAYDDTDDGLVIWAVQLGPTWFFAHELWADTFADTLPPFLAALTDALRVKLATFAADEQAESRIDMLEAA